MVNDILIISLLLHCLQNELESTDVNNESVSAGDFFAQYSKLLQQSHGNVDDGDEETMNDAANEEDYAGTEGENEVDNEEKIPVHFDIIIKVGIFFPQI